MLIPIHVLVKGKCPPTQGEGLASGGVMIIVVDDCGLKNVMLLDMNNCDDSAEVSDLVIHKEN